MPLGCPSPSPQEYFWAFTRQPAGPQVARAVRPSICLCWALGGLGGRRVLGCLALLALAGLENLCQADAIRDLNGHVCNYFSTALDFLGFCPGVVRDQGLTCHELTSDSGPFLRHIDNPTASVFGFFLHVSSPTSDWHPRHRHCHGLGVARPKPSSSCAAFPPWMGQTGHMRDGSCPKEWLRSLMYNTGHYLARSVKPQQAVLD